MSIYRFEEGQRSEAHQTSDYLGGPAGSPPTLTVAWISGGGLLPGHFTAHQMAPIPAAVAAILFSLLFLFALRAAP